MTNIIFHLLISCSIVCTNDADSSMSIVSIVVLTSFRMHLIQVKYEIEEITESTMASTHRCYCHRRRLLMLSNLGQCIREVSHHDQILKILCH